MKNTSVISLSIASLVSFICARGECSPDHAARMAAARLALEQKLNELDHLQAQPPLETNFIATAAEPVRSAIIPADAVRIHPAASQPEIAATTPAEAAPNWTNDRTPDSRTWMNNLYVKVDFGGIYQQANTTLFQTAPFPTSGTASFDLGMRGNIVLGYDLNRSLAVELDTGVLWSSMDKINGISLNQPYPFNTHFDTYTIPFLANVIYKFPLGDSFVPYVGAGVGGAANILYFSEGVSGMNDCSFVFAYQAELGLKYNISERASIGVAYAFLGSTDPEWHSVIALNGLPAMDYGFKEKGFYTHSFIVSFSWHF